ncbi:MAG: hypothetical protein BWY74_03567 [Firmicutes bacterium ADurb.Bin419]|nr:MAG: hypothetical protein BWY74_03567 [Firmicutes bacterium ADurb.Bin419]
MAPQQGGGSYYPGAPVSNYQGNGQMQTPYQGTNNVPSPSNTVSKVPSNGGVNNTSTRAPINNSTTSKVVENEEVPRLF